MCSAPGQFPQRLAPFGTMMTVIAPLWLVGYWKSQSWLLSTVDQASFTWGQGSGGAVSHPQRGKTLRPSLGDGLVKAISPLKIVTWLILPVVICLSQRLSHACLSISNLYSETANGSLNQL